MGGKSRAWLNSAAEPVTVEDLVTDVLTGRQMACRYIWQSGSAFIPEEDHAENSDLCYPGFNSLARGFQRRCPQLPESLMDKDKPGREYWCRGNNINTHSLLNGRCQ